MISCNVTTKVWITEAYRIVENISGERGNFLFKVGAFAPISPLAHWHSNIIFDWLAS